MRKFLITLKYLRCTYVSRKAVSKSLSELLVNPTGEMSNFLAEDYEAVLKFLNAEKQKTHKR